MNKHYNNINIKNDDGLLSFQSTGYTHIYGNLDLSEYALNSNSDIDELSNVEYVQGSLDLINYNNSLYGLRNLKYVGGSLNLAEYQGKDLVGLEKLEYAGGLDLISFNGNLSALKKLKKVDDYLDLSNYKGTNIDALHNIEYIGGDLDLDLYKLNKKDVMWLLTLLTNKIQKGKYYKDRTLIRLLLEMGLDDNQKAYMKKITKDFRDDGERTIFDQLIESYNK